MEQEATEVSVKRKSMKQRRILPLLLCLAFLCTGCGRVWAKTMPIRDLRIIETVGCDLAREGTALSVYAAKPGLRLRQEGPSLRIAMDRMREEAASPALFFSHTQFILAGQAMAADDLAPVLDLVARSETMRLQIPLFLLQNADAFDAVQLGNEERNVTKMLASLREDMAQQGTGHAFSCGEILQALSESGAALAAACTVGQDALHSMGYGILKDGKCIGWIAAPEEQGVDLLLSLGGHGDVRLPDATMTIERCGTSIEPQWEENRLSRLDITLELRASLSETDGQPGVTTEAGRKALERQLSETVKGWIEALLRRSQALQADFLGLGGMIAERDPKKWYGIRFDWSEIFPDLPWTVTVETTLDRTQDLQEPLNLGGAP